MYEVYFTTEAKKFLKKLNKEDKSRIISTIERCRVRPQTHIKKLVASIAEG